MSQVGVTSPWFFHLELRQNNTPRHWSVRCCWECGGILTVPPHRFWTHCERDSSGRVQATILKKL